jgi:hypothetical protein
MIRVPEIPLSAGKAAPLGMTPFRSVMKFKPQSYRKAPEGSRNARPLL